MPSPSLYECRRGRPGRVKWLQTAAGLVAANLKPVWCHGLAGDIGADLLRNLRVVRTPALRVASIAYPPIRPAPACSQAALSGQCTWLSTPSPSPILTLRLVPSFFFFSWLLIPLPSGLLVCANAEKKSSALVPLSPPATTDDRAKCCIYRVSPLTPSSRNSRVLSLIQPRAFSPRHHRTLSPVRIHGRSSPLPFHHKILQI